MYCILSLLFLAPKQIHSNGWIELVQKNGSSFNTAAGVLVIPPEMTADTFGHVFYRETTDPDLLSSMGKALDQLFPGFGNPIAMFVITYGSHSENKVRSISIIIVSGLCGKLFMRKVTTSLRVLCIPNTLAPVMASIGYLRVN